MKSAPLLFSTVFLSSVLAAQAQPTFRGLQEALPAPGAAVLKWERATGADAGNAKYRVYRKEPAGWNFRTPVAEVSGDEWVILGLAPGQPVEFIVRAAAGGREDQNTRAMTVTPTGAQPAEEWRSIWVNRFEWTSGNRGAVQGRLRTMMSTLNQANFNAVLFQVRGQGDTLYPSPDEPWSDLISLDARSIDPVAFALDEARRNNIEFHAWMNLSTIWQSGAKRPPTDRRHPYFRFADAASPTARLGLVHDSKGEPVQWGSDGYVWLTPGNPEVNAYLRRQVVQFVEKYPVHGVHWDDRTGNPNGVSRDPISVRRFGARGNPMQMKDFGEWQRDQLTRMLSNIYVHARATRPGILVTASPFGIADRTRIPGYSRFSDGARFGVAPEVWLSRGVLDALIPQIYWDLPDPDPNFGTVARDWIRNNKSGRPIWTGSSLNKYPVNQPLVPDQQRLVAIQRAIGSGGISMYNWSSARPEVWVADGRKVFPAKARVPVPAHLQRPMGQAMGWLTTPAGQPLVDGWVRIKGENYVYTSCGDGFFGIPNVTPGVYTLQLIGPAGKLQEQQVTIQAGQTAVLRLTLE